MYNIILWGTGIIYNTHLNVLKLYERVKEIRIVGVTASDLGEYEEIDGYKVYRSDNVKNLNYDYLMIMNECNFLDITNKAVEVGVPNEKIISYKVLEIPNLSFNKYFKLKSKQLSIISNNCWGGIVYEKLGLECLSPFKNLFLEDEDYLKLLLDLELYIQSPLEFDHYEVDVHSKERYPVMKLRDICIHCNHDKDIAIVKKNWERRKAKINYDSLFIEMYTENERIAEKFCALEEYPNRLCFTPFEMNSLYSMRLKLEGKQKEFYEAVNSNPTKGNTYDLIDLLNMKKHIRKK